MHYATTTKQMGKQENSTLGSIGLREAVYCLNNNFPIQKGMKTSNYEEIWKEVKEKYGYLANVE